MTDDIRRFGSSVPQFVTNEPEELLGYLAVKEVEGLRGALGVQQMLYTGGLMYGITPDGCHRGRYCYPTLGEALAALDEWDGAGDPPGDWIKEFPSERRGPGFYRIAAGRDSDAG